jgi:hypothetical protein
MKFRLVGKRWIGKSFHKEECDMVDKSCLKKVCLVPHDFGYRLSNGTWRKYLTCLTRERGGCK